MLDNWHNFTNIKILSNILEYIVALLFKSYTNRVFCFDKSTLFKKRTPTVYFDNSTARCISGL